jgi:hypothetical protein
MPRPPSARATRRIFLLVPFKDKDEASALGAGFEFYKPGQRPPGKPPGYCFIPPGELIAPFAKWRRAGNPFAPDPTKLPTSVPGGKNAAAVALGSLGGRAGGHKGGKARAANRSPEELSAIGRKGAAARQAKAMERRRAELALQRGEGIKADPVEREDVSPGHIEEITGVTPDDPDDD